MTEQAPTQQPKPFPLMRAAGTLALAVGLVLLAIHLTLDRLGYAQQIQWNLLAAAVCGGAGLVGLLPVWHLSRKHPHGAAQGFMVGILLRMAVAGGAVIVTQWVLKVPGSAGFSMWVGAWYLIVLTVEVKLVAGFVLRHSTVATIKNPASGELPGAGVESAR